MPGLSDPKDASFTEGHQAGAWRWNADAGRWEPTDPLLATGFSLPRALGLEATPINAGAPGSYLSAGNSEADRARMAGYLSQLQGQAATGGGAWEQVLAQNTDATKAGAMALGQSQEGVDPMTAGRNIGNAAAGAEQRAVGQGNLLRAQTQQQATGQLSDILAGQQGLDAQQAAGQSGAAQGLAQANHSLQSQAVKNQKDLVSGFGQAAVTMGASNGGEVPGKPKVFGDSSVNDTVDAKLTPLEIVLPLSVTMAPDAPDRAAAFVAAVKARGATGETHFDGGGQVPNFTDIQGEDAQGRSSTHEWLASGDKNVISSTPIVGPPEKTYAPGKVPPLVENGGLLDTHNYNQTRNAALVNQDALGAAAAGYGPSVAPQAMQNATDSTVAGVLRADANSHGGANPNLVGAGAEQQQEAAGNAAGMVAGEQQRTGGTFAEAVNRQRSQDLALSTAAQQAAWHNTMMNAGIGLEQQAQLRNVLGATGQGAMAASSLFPSGAGDLPHGYSTSTHDGGLDYSSDHSDSSASHGGAESSHYAEGGVVAHLARHGTRQPPRRPTGKVAPSTPETAEPRPTGLEYRDLREHPEASGGASVDERARIGGMLKKIERARIQQYDTENPDLKDLEPAYADGGEVNFTGAANGAPQPGPFAAPQANSGSLLDFLARLQAPGGGPMAEATRVRPPPTPEELVLQSRNGVTPPAAPRMPTDVATRERPFATKPPQSTPVAPPAQPAPLAKAPPRPAAPQVDPLADQKRALGMEAEAKSTQADATAQALGGLQQKLEANAIAQNEAHAHAAEQAEQQLGVIQQAREEMKSINTTVDPDRLMARRGWGGRITAIIGLVLGAIGNDNGINRAAQLLNQQIDRDLDAQKSEHELALRKGQSAVDSAQTVYSLSRQMTQDDIAANLAARGTMLDLAKNQIDIAAAKAGAPLAKSNLAMLSAQLDAEKKKADEALKQRSFDNHIKQQNADSDRLRALKEGNAPGVAAQTALLATVQTEETTIKQQGEKLKKLIEKYGTREMEIGGSAAEAEMRQAVDNMAVAAAKMKDPNSAARPSEVEIESRNIFTPSLLKNQKAALQQINSYLANSEQRRKNAFSARGAEVPGVPATVAKKLMRLPSGEVVEVR